MKWCLRTFGICTAVLLSVTIVDAQIELQAADSKKTTRDIHKLRPQFPAEQLIEKSKKAIDDGLAFLVASQNKDGSWGSHHPRVTSLKDFGFKTGNRGSQDAVRTACTAICAEALLNQPELNATQKQVLEKAIGELLIVTDSKTAVQIPKVRKHHFIISIQLKL